MMVKTGKNTVGRYEILSPLGEGGMAVVYKALDTRLDADVALKMMRAERIDPDAIQRFEREAKALARLTHPNIVKVLDYGEHEGKPYLVMEYLPGGTLKERLGKPLSWQEAVKVLLPLAGALDFAHGQGIVHRDVKPSNILFTQSGEPMISDFGVAKMLNAAADVTGLTSTGVNVGTPAYMAPEQFQGSEVSAQTDLYALGAVFYEMLTGHKPYEAETPSAIIWKQASEAVPAPGKVVPGLPLAVDDVVLAMLAKDPAQRPQGIHACALLLEGLLAGKNPAGVQRVGDRERKQVHSAAQEDLKKHVELRAGEGESQEPRLAEAIAPYLLILAGLVSVIGLFIVGDYVWYYTSSQLRLIFMVGCIGSLLLIVAAIGLFLRRDWGRKWGLAGAMLLQAVGVAGTFSSMLSAMGLGDLDFIIFPIFVNIFFLGISWGIYKLLASRRMAARTGGNAFPPAGICFLGTLFAMSVLGIPACIFLLQRKSFALRWAKYNLFFLMLVFAGLGIVMVPYTHEYFWIILWSAPWIGVCVWYFFYLRKPGIRAFYETEVRA